MKEGTETLKCLAAGGAIRDMLLGRRPHDYDFVFHGGQEEFIQSNPKARKTGKGDKCIFICNGQEFCPLYKDDPVADIQRRDFTINALLLSDTGILHCHPSTLSDLKAGILRPIHASSMADDPVRLFRAARLVAAFPVFTPHEECLSQMRGLSQESLAAIAPERVGAELQKACLAQAPGNFLALLASTGSFSSWFAEFTKADTIPAGPVAYHSRTVLGHTIRVMDETAALAREQGFFAPNDKTRALAVWMALCHDLGKTLTPCEEWPHHYGHEGRGGSLAEKLGLRLRLPSLFVKAGKLSALLHMKAGMYARLRPGTRVDLLVTLHKAGIFIPFFLMVACDSQRPDILVTVQRDLAILTRVRLPENWRNKGPLSFARLRDMRCEAIAHNTMKT